MSSCCIANYFILTNSESNIYTHIVTCEKGFFSTRFLFSWERHVSPRLAGQIDINQTGFEKVGALEVFSSYRENVEHENSNKIDII